MDPSDVEMEPAEHPPQPQPQQPPPPQPQPAAAGDGWSMLSRARGLLQEGQPSLALQAVLLAIRSQGGEQALIQTLNRARDLYRQRSQPAPNADELAFARIVCYSRGSVIKP
ncbi:hypothetical protein ZWY2020_034450 [Hordeum vulgare]|nr:hypothetical protein ZWY2020_034450 [Hordeum vulgare]